MRLIVKDWESFLTGGVDGTEKPTFPQIDLSKFHGAVSPQVYLQTGSLAILAISGSGSFNISSDPLIVSNNLLYSSYAS